MIFPSFFLVAIAAVALSLALPVRGVPLPRRTAVLSPSFATLPKPILAPYYLYFGNKATASLADAYDQINLRAATIGFVTAVPGTCKLTADLDMLVDDVAAYIAKGGAVNLSFGGAIGQSTTHAHLQDACSDVNKIAELIIGQLERFKTHNAEFDIEDPALLANDAATQRLASALAIVQKRIPDLHLTYTLATLPSGMPAAQLGQVQAAKNVGVDVDIVALMTMDMVPTDVEASSEAAILAGAKQVEKVYNLPSGSGLKRMGVIPMIGRDDLGAHFSVSDSAKLAAFVSEKKIAYMTFWNLNRDFSGGDITIMSGARDQREPYQFFNTMRKNIVEVNDGAPANPTPTKSSISSSSASGRPWSTSSSSVPVITNTSVAETTSVNPGEVWTTSTVTVTASFTSATPTP